MNSHDRTAIKLQQAVRRMALCVGLALTAGWLVVAGLGAAQAQGKIPLTPRSVAAFDRPEDPVVITGTRLPAFSGVPLNELKLYASHGGGWAAIPFQIDEVNISGTYVISDDGLLDGNDELVFMAGDAGDSISAADWPADTPARLNPRYVITVTDPLSASHQAWAYLYRSATLAESSVSYITWTYAAQTAAAMSYTAAFSPTKFVGLSDLFINGGNVDLLDRQKIRVATFIGTFNEEFLATLAPATITLPIAGPVRAATNNGDLKAAFYGSRIDFDVTFNLSPLPFSPNFIRTSFDWNNPNATGITHYYDSNTVSGATIDGIPDVISTTPRASWFQVNGGIAGPGGLVMAIPRIDPGGGTVTNYYKDDSTIDSNDTGDKRSYGDDGLFINAPGSIISFTLMAYVLPPGASTNVGATYFARASNPLLATTAQQCYAPAGHCLTVYLPLVMKNFAGTR